MGNDLCYNLMDYNAELYRVKAVKYKKYRGKRMHGYLTCMEDTTMAVTVTRYVTT